MVFLYDGTYPGFLTAVYEIYHKGTSHLVGIRKEGREYTLFGNEIHVETSFLKAEKVAISFGSCCGKEALRWMYRAFLAEEEGKEMKIFYFLRRGFKLKKGIYRKQREPWVMDILKLCQKVGNEMDKFRGILRFSELEDGLLFAEIQPTHHILPLLAPHFADRFSTKRWAIYDRNRHEAVVYEKGKVSFVFVEKEEMNLTYSRGEEDFRQMWRNYYRHMGIEERRNPGVRMNFIPKKYWAHLTEMADPYNRADRRMTGLPERKRPHQISLDIRNDEFRDVLKLVEKKSAEKLMIEGKKEDSQVQK